MPEAAPPLTFRSINRAYNSVFVPGELSLGMVVPIENYQDGPVPTMTQHLERVRLIDNLGFKALWLRDIPLNVPSFGDAGQTFDPFTYLGYLTGQTKDIALGIASIALPLHHPVHVAKSAATIDQLSGGRLIMGVATGDRPAEFPALGLAFEQKGARFREAFAYVEKAKEAFPVFESDNFGNLSGQSDVLPKPTGEKLPMLITGFSQQSLDWIAENGDGWMSYPRGLDQQKTLIEKWRGLIAKNQDYDQPFMQPLYVILEEDDDFKPQPIQLGFRIGINYLIEYLHLVRSIGVNHVAINLRFNTRPMEATLEKLAHRLLPHFHSKNAKH